MEKKKKGRGREVRKGSTKIYRIRSGRDGKVVKGQTEKRNVKKLPSKGRGRKTGTRGCRQLNRCR